MTYPLTETQYRDTLTAHMPPGYECKQSTWSQLMCRGASTLHKPSTALFFSLVLVLIYKRELFSITACLQAFRLCPRLNRELSVRPAVVLSRCACRIEILCLSCTLDCFVHPSFTLPPQSSEVFLPFSFTDLLLSLSHYPSLASL